MTSKCDEACPDSTLSICNSKKTGWSYSRTCKDNGKKIEVLRSSGKHLNAILSCLQWMKSNMLDFVRDRPLRIGEGRLKFFEALKDAACIAPSAGEEEAELRRIGCVKFSEHIVNKLRSEGGLFTQGVRKTLADLILIGLDNNQQYVSAISTNYRRCSQKKTTSKIKKPTASYFTCAVNQSLSVTNDVQHMNDVCTCGSATQSRAKRHLKVTISKSEK